MHASTTTERVRPGHRSCARLLPVSSGASENLKIQNMFPRLSLSMILITRAPGLPPPPSAPQTVLSFPSPIHPSPQVISGLHWCSFRSLTLYPGSPTSPAAAWIQVRIRRLHLPPVLIPCQNVASPSPSPFLSETVYYEEPQPHLPTSAEFSSLLWVSFNLSCAGKH
jgi:hypothetical protein